MRSISYEACTHLRRSHSRDKNVIQLQRSTYKQLYHASCFNLSIITFTAQNTFRRGFRSVLANVSILLDYLLFGATCEYMTPQFPVAFNASVERFGRMEEKKSDSLSKSLVITSFTFDIVSLSTILFLIFISVFYVFDSFSFQNISLTFAKCTAAHYATPDELSQNRRLFFPTF